MEWWVFGEQHRDGGLPATIVGDTMQWHIKGRRVPHLVAHDWAMNNAMKKILLFTKLGLNEDDLYTLFKTYWTSIKTEFYFFV
jgi:hypothetical protein